MLTKEIRIAKRSYIWETKKLENRFSANNHAPVGLKDITSSEKPSPDTVENHQQADHLNVFCCWFDKASHSSPTQTAHCTPCHPLTPLHWPSICTQDLWEGCVSAPSETEDQEGTRPRWHFTLLSKNLCWSVGHHRHTDLQQIAGAVWSAILLQTLNNQPGPQETLYWCWPTWRTSQAPYWTPCCLLSGYSMWSPADN